MVGITGYPWSGNDALSPAVGVPQSPGARETAPWINRIRAKDDMGSRGMNRPTNISGAAFHPVKRPMVQRQIRRRLLPYRDISGTQPFQSAGAKMVQKMDLSRINNQ
jgi:hypothetical protein